MMMNNDDRFLLVSREMLEELVRKQADRILA